ncbi:MAG: DUF1800 domain-containing protein [Acidobacteriota bacterium]|nr:DUF1800 domain-containing protein [Acidobacteriota bacterium]
METKPGFSLRIFGQKCLSFCLLALLLCFAANAFAAEEIPDSTDPVLISVSDSTRALATSADTFRSALPRKNTEVFQPGTRVTIFVTNVDLIEGEGANAFRVFAEDARGTQYRLTVENIQPVRKMDWIYALTIRLHDEVGYNGQPEANGDVLIRVSWRGNTSNRVRLGLGETGGKIKGDAGAVPTPAPAVRPTQSARLSTTAADRKRFMEQAAFGPTPALDLRLRQIGFKAWIEEQFTKQPTFPYPDFPLKSADVNNTTYGCPNDINSQLDDICRRDHYSQYQNQNWMFKEALYGEDQLRRRVSWALHQIWVVSGLDGMQQRWMQEYFEVLDKHAFGNYRDLMKDMTLNPAMGEYLDMVRSTRTNPNENYPREILQLFAVGLDILNQDGTPILDNQGNRIPTYDQEKVNQFTKVFTGWTLCNNGANPACPNFSTGTPNYIDPMYIANSNNHDLTAKALFDYPGAPNPTIPACTNCTTNDARIAYANDSLNKTLDNIFYHPNAGPFIGKLLIQHLVTSDPSPAYVSRVAAVFNNNGSGMRGDMKAVIKAILLDPEARGTRKTEPNYGKLREPFQYVTNLLRTSNVRAANSAPASCGNRSDGVINGITNQLGQNVWNPPTVFNYFPPDYIVPGTDVVGPEFALHNTGTSFGRINVTNTLVFGQIAFQQPTAANPSPNQPCGTSIDLTEATAWATSDPNGNALIEGLNTRMMHGTMSQAMKDKIRTAINVAGMTAAQKAQQAVYLVASSSQYQIQR